MCCVVLAYRFAFSASVASLKPRELLSLVVPSELWKPANRFITQQSRRGEKSFTSLHNHSHVLYDAV